MRATTLQPPVSQRAFMPHGVPIGPLGLTFTVMFAFEALLAAMIVSAADVRIAPDGFVQFGLLAVGMYAVAVWCRVRRLEPTLGTAAAIVATGTLSVMLCATISNVGLRLGAPLVDGRLAAADAAFGLSSGKIITGIASYPTLGTVLVFFYDYAAIAVVMLFTWTLLRKQGPKAWELAATLIIAMQMIAIASPAFPAWGAMRQFNLEKLNGHGLPEAAGVYQWPSFTHFREGTDSLLHLTDMGGVVAFPSFHMVLAMLIAHALADGPLRWLGVGCAAAVAVSAIPMGGHYVVDLAAGFAIWVVAALIARRISIPSG